MRFDCLPSSSLCCGLAITAVFALLAFGCEFVSDACGEDSCPRRDASFCETVSGAASAVEDCATAVLAQNEIARPSAVRTMRAKQRPWRRDRARLVGLDETATTNLFGSMSLSFTVLPLRYTLSPICLTEI